MITEILDRRAALPPDVRRACDQIFDVALATGRAEVPEPMRAWVERQFGSLDDVRQQTIVRIVNRLTLEATLFNPLRARRPSIAPSDDAAIEARVVADLADDLFRDPERDTTADVFGRVRGRYCVSASNVAKYDGWHGLVIFDEPHPLRFGRPQLEDYVDVALRWIRAAHERDPQAIYPVITWNCMPKSGATLMHGHMQIALARGMHYARVESWRRAAEAYRANNRASYFDDLFAVHHALGLALDLAGDVRAFAHLTPLRNREVVLLAGPSARHNGWPAEELAGALYDVLRRLIDRQGVRAFNVMIALPPLQTTAEDWRGVPLVARLADRGDALACRGDWGAMELFATGCVTVDPFDVVATS